MREFTDLITILDAKDKTGVGNIAQMEEYKHITVMVATEGSANLTVKCQGSIMDTAPNFGASQSPTNHWEYLDMIDLTDGSSVPGSTGISVSGTDICKLYEVNVSCIKWLTFNVTARSAGKVTVKIKGAYS